MKTIRTKIICVIIICSMLAAGIVGIFSTLSATKTTEESSEEMMVSVRSNHAEKVDAWIERTEQSVNTLTAIIQQNLDEKQFLSNKKYADTYSEEIKDVILDFAENTDGAISTYIRYNPEYSNPTSGVFYNRSSLDADFDVLEPTDFTMYDPSDSAHVGWYYIPVANKAPMWMSPYLNENINVYMISYIVPIYAGDGTSIGIIGMDIDFAKITDMIDEASVYQTGYAFLIDQNGVVMHHPKLEINQKLTDAGVTGIETTLSDIASGKESDLVYTYNYENEQKQLTYKLLGNGMAFVLTAPRNEILAASRHMAIQISCLALIAIFVAIVIASIISGTISKPIKQLTGVIEQTAALDFAPTKNGGNLRNYHDEIGKMAREIHNMRKKLREMVGQMKDVENTIDSNVENLDMIMQENNGRSQDNSAATQQIAAGMQEAAEHTMHIASNIDEVKRNSETIFHMSEDGKQNSEKILERAAEMKETTQQSSERVMTIYDEMMEKSTVAVEQSKSVEKINELTEAIKKISNQTNLLALNANIEAARAGEAGKGFVVVASEIGTLAAQTLHTVEDINNIVTEVNEAVSNLTGCILTTNDFLETTVISDYTGFRQSVEQYHEDAVSFITLMGNIRNEVEKLDHYINQIVNSSEEINERVSQSSEGISIIASKSTEAVSSTLDGYEKLNECKMVVDQLKEIIEKFRL